MSGPFDFLHIKGRTVGSSNELSFDVLDAARSDMEGKKTRSKRMPTGPKPSQGSYHGVTGTATFSAAPEVARRKKARRAHSVRTGFVAVFAAAALVASGAFFLYQFVESKNNFNGRFNMLIEQLVEIDKGLVEIDDLMKDPVKMIDIAAGLDGDDDFTQEGSYETTSSIIHADSLSRFPSVKRELNSIVAEAQTLKEIVSRDEELAVLSQLEAAGKARLSMVGAAEEASGIAAEATNRVGLVNDVWSKVLKADSMAREATDLANEADTEETTMQAREETEKARELFIEAKEELVAQGNKKPKVEFKEEAEYLEKRVEALGEAIKTANYLLIHNREGANSANNDYNAADKAAASLALKLPDSEAEKIVEIYRSDLQKVGDEYEKERAAASTADSSIRSYVERT